MELDQVHRGQVEVRQARFDRAANVVGRENVLQLVAAPRRPLAGAGRDFGGDVEFALRVGADEFTEQYFTPPVAVGEGGVEEVAAEVHGQLQGAARLDVVRP